MPPSFRKTGFSLSDCSPPEVVVTEDVRTLADDMLVVREWDPVMADKSFVPGPNV